MATVTLANVRFDIQIVNGASKPIQTCWMTFLIPAEWLDMSLATSFDWRYSDYTLYPTVNASPGSGQAIVHMEWPWPPVDYDPTEEDENYTRIKELKDFLTHVLNASFGALPIPEKTTAQMKADRAEECEKAAAIFTSVANTANKTLTEDSILILDTELIPTKTAIDYPIED